MLTLLALAFLAFDPTPEARILWVEGKWYPPSTPPASLTEAARALISREAAFAAEQGLRLYASADPPVVIVSSWRESLAIDLVETVGGSIAEFPRLFPTPAGPAPLPIEELDGADPTAPFPIYLLDPGPVYTALVERLVKEHEYLKDWREKALNLQGFHIYRPRIVVILSGSNNWDPKNQLVHDTTHVLAYPRYGRQPFWIEEGMAWYAEDAALPGVFAFCYRDNFLWDAEKFGWSLDLSRVLKGGKGPKVETLAGLRPGAYTAGDGGEKDARALLAYGLVAYLSNERPDAFASLLMTFAKDVAEVGEFAPTYEIPHETQRTMLLEALGADIDKQVAAFASKLTRDIPKPKKPPATPPKSGAARAPVHR